MGNVDNQQTAHERMFSTSPRIIQALCEKGADFTLTDIEGNTPKDLAEKNSHSKCVKYLGSLMKERLPRGANGSIVVSTERPLDSSLSSYTSSMSINMPFHLQQGGKPRRGLYRSKRSSGEVMDSYRHAPPHQVMRVLIIHVYSIS